MVTVAASTPACEVCGREWSPEDESKDWLGLEIDHSGGRIYAAFCSPAHAQDFFARPLPKPPPGPAALPLATGERLMILGVGGLAVIAFSIFVFGLVVLVRVALHWF